MLEVLFLDTAKDVFNELTTADQEAIIEGLQRARSFPEMYPVRESRPFRGYRPLSPVVDGG
jgi:hypothetical protein